MEKIVLIGAGGHAKTIVDTLERNGNYKLIGFIEREYDKDFSYRGYSIIGIDADLEAIYRNGVQNAVVSIGYLGESSVRERLYIGLKKIGYKFPVIIDGSACVATDVRIGEGTYIGRNAVINANAHVGKMCIINTAAIVEHDCCIGDFSHISVGTVLCGEVKVGKKCFIGANATVLQQRSIGNEVIVGAGTIVTENIKDMIVMRNKMEKIKKNRELHK